MSNSLRAQEKRRKRSGLSKHQKDHISAQHFGDEHVFRGRVLKKGENKQKLIEEARSQTERKVTTYVM